MPDLPFYKPHQVADLRIGYYSVNSAYERLIFKYLVLPLTNEAAQEYARHGFVRRLGTLKRAVENVYSVYPPDRFDRPTRDECLNIAINLQSFLFNVFGCIDNLARVWVNKKQVKDNRGRPLRDQQIGLRSGCAAVRFAASSSAATVAGYLKVAAHQRTHLGRQPRLPPQKTRRLHTPFAVLAGTTFRMTRPPPPMTWPGEISPSADAGPNGPEALPHPGITDPGGPNELLPGSNRHCPL